MQGRVGIALRFTRNQNSGPRRVFFVDTSLAEVIHHYTVWQLWDGFTAGLFF